MLTVVSTVPCFFFFQAEDGIRDADVTGVQTCALPISISLYYYASKFMPLSLGFLSMLIGRTLLPTLSALSASGDCAALKAEIERAFRLALFLLVPLLSALWVGRDAMLSLLLYRVAFSDAG